MLNEPLLISNYDRLASETDQLPDDNAVPILGVFGEVGSLLSELKKHHREGDAYVDYRDSVIEEMGDVLWYVAAFARREGSDLASVAHNAMHRSNAWPAPPRAVETLTFANLRDSLAERRESAAIERTMLVLASDVGRLVDEATRTGGTFSLAGPARLVSVLEALTLTAEHVGIDLQEVATANLQKVQDRWPSNRHFRPLFDENDHALEQFPRLFEVDVFEREANGRRYVHQQINGVNIGDRLTDNAMQADDYRYHDAFHYAYVAVLGWSPVVRSLLKRKRKSNDQVDDAEDGARSIIMEEGVAGWIFSQAKDMNLFEELQEGQLPLGILKQIRTFVEGREVQNIPLWVWERAILQGYAAFRYLRENRRGRLIVDMNTRELRTEALPQ